MSEKIVVPTLGESVTEATVAKWLKNKGDKVISDEPLVELETDKVNVEVPSPSSGILDNISAKEGETVNVGALLGSISQTKSSVKDQKDEIHEKNYSPPKLKESDPIQIKNKPKQKKAKKKLAEPLNLIEETNNKIFNEPLVLEEEPLVLNEEHNEKSEESSKKIINNEPRISPAARKIALEKKIDVSSIKGSGKNGLVLKEDLMSLMGSKPAPSQRKISHGPEERIKMTRLRLTIAKRLKENRKCSNAYNI